MGEYALRLSDRQEVKIGTCESMYYLRYEDRAKVGKLPHSLNAATEKNLFWRLPYPDEDKARIGEYSNHDRGYVLMKHREGGFGEYFTSPKLADHHGSVQLSHKCGLLINVPCYHGEKLPEVLNGNAHWNGKGYFYELAFVKNTDQGVLPIVRCRACGDMWRFRWADIWDYILDDIKPRFVQHKKESEWIFAKNLIDKLTPYEINKLRQCHPITPLDFLKKELRDESEEFIKAIYDALSKMITLP